MMTNDDERGGRGVKNAQNLMTSYVNDPLQPTVIASRVPHLLLEQGVMTRFKDDNIYSNNCGLASPDKV